MQDGSVGRIVLVLALSLFTAGGMGAAITGVPPGLDTGGSDRTSTTISWFGDLFVSAAQATEVEAGDGYALLPTTGTADLITAREAWGMGPAPKDVAAPLATGASSPLLADTLAAPKGFEGEPTFHPLQVTPPPQLTPVPQDHIADALKKLFTQREAWLKAPAAAPTAPQSADTGYAVLPTTSAVDLIAQRETWGASPSSSSQPSATDAAAAASSTSSGYAVLPTTGTADLIAAREAWGKGPAPKDVPAPLATGAYSPLPSSKVEVPKGFEGEPTIHALQATPAAQLTPVPQGQLDDALTTLLAQRESWLAAPSQAAGSAKAVAATVAAAPVSTTSGSTNGYALLPTTGTAELFSTREAWGKGKPAKKVAAPLAAGAKSPLPTAKMRSLKGFSGEPKVYALQPTPAPQLTPVPQGQLDSAMNKLLAERESWGTAPLKAQVAAAAPRSAEAADCEAKLRQAAASGVILFKSSSATLSARSNQTLAQLASIAKDCKKGRIRVEGHTDSTGRASFNTSLSEQRAKAVVQYLTKAGLAADRIEAVGYGQDKPVASNATPAGRAKNRRIEFSVVE